MKKRLLFGLSLLMVTTMSFAQDRTVSGKVTSSEDGTTLPGVNVVVKGTTNGGVTDIDGNYKISVPEDGVTLVFSFIGLESQEVEIGTRSVIDLQMASDITQLSEVIVTAIGVERQTKALGYSVETVQGDQVQQIAEPDPLRGLQGKVAGVAITGSSGAPGSSTKVTIRGNSSLLGNNQPLYVVDGIPYNSDFITTGGGLTGGGAFSSRISDLDPNNIESMTVLKGGAGAALYGSRAANGVVLITTKTGSGKATNKKGLEVTFSTLYAVEEIGNLPDVQNTYGTGTNFTYAQANGSWGAPFIGTKPYATLETIPHWYSGRPGMEAYDGVEVPYKAYPNNISDVFDQGSLTENSLSISGGGEKSVFSTTLTQMNQKGFVPGSKFERYNISVGGKSTLSNGLYVAGNIAVTKSQQDGPISGVGSLGQNNTSFFARALLLGRNWDINGQPYQNPVDKGSEFFVGRSNANHPFWAAENTGIRSDVDRYTASTVIGYDIMEGLNVTLRLGVNTYNQIIQEFQRPNGTGTPIGTLTEQNARQTEVNTDLVITYTKDLSEDLNLSVLAGNNINQRTSNAQQINGAGYAIFDIDDLDNIGAISPAGGGYARKRIAGLYVDATVGYRDFAFITVTGRNDWSSTLPKDGNSFFYPAVTGSLVISDMVSLPSWATFVKVRGGWSQVGNDTNPYLLSTPFLVNNYLNVTSATAQKPFRGISSATYSNGATDPNLLPETTTEFEGGVDLKIFERFGLNATYYKKSTTDLIASVSLADETGFTSLLTNFGELTNEGVELGLDITPISLDNGFDWNIFATFTHNKNKIVSLKDGVDEIQFGSGFAGGVISVHRPGQEYGLILGSVDARDQEGNLLIDPSNGQLIPALGRQIIGNPNPDFIAGLTNTFSFKGISLSAVLDWKQGGDVYANQVSSELGRGVLAFQGEGREIMNIIPGVYGDPNTLEPIRGETGEKITNQTIVETNTLYFGQTFAANGSDEWAVWDGTVFRLREVSLNWSLPQAWLNKTFLGRASLGIVGRNLWFNAPNFPPGSNYDPEVSQFGTRNAQGIDFGAAPSAKRYAVKLSVTF